jgi:hypothetical protein
MVFDFESIKKKLMKNEKIIGIFRKYIQENPKTCPRCYIFSEYKQNYKKIDGFKKQNM